jgi:secreted trypsin-like serine protease
MSALIWKGLDWHGEVTDLNVCKRRWVPNDNENFTRNTMICTTGPTTAFKGDSGGPLVIQVGGRLYQLGVTHSGEHLPGHTATLGLVTTHVQHISDR